MRSTLSVVLLGAACVASGCDRPKDEAPSEEPAAKKGAAEPERFERAVAQIYPTKGNDAKGTVRFQRLDGELRVSIDVEGLEPSTEHGFHVHEFGDCTAPDAASAGDHYNPTNAPHGLPSESERHVGDFGNLKSDANGRAKLEKTIELPSEQGSIIGRALIIHARPDEGTQPTGNSGARIGCGVIGIVNGRKPS